MEVSAPDAEYLKKTVGDVLAKGIAAVTLAQPVDPVAFLADWLIKYVEF
jgi:Dpy-30 motif